MSRKESYIYKGRTENTNKMMPVQSDGHHQELGDLIEFMPVWQPLIHYGLLHSFCILTFGQYCAWPEWVEHCTTGACSHKKLSFLVSPNLGFHSHCHCHCQFSSDSKSTIMNCLYCSGRMALMLRLWLQELEVFHAALLWVGCDVPGARKMCGFMGHASNRGCCQLDWCTSAKFDFGTFKPGLKARKMWDLRLSHYFHQLERKEWLSVKQTGCFLAVWYVLTVDALRTASRNCKVFSLYIFSNEFLGVMLHRETLVPLATHSS